MKREPSYFVLLWNPDLERTASFPFHSEKERESNWTWSTGVSRRPVPGDRVLLRKTGRGERGIVGAGTVIRGAARSEVGTRATFVQVKWDSVGHDVIVKQEEEPNVAVLWTAQGGGEEIDAGDGLRIFAKVTAHRKQSSVSRFAEGQVRSVLQVGYERDADARNKCLLHYGSSFDCEICGFNFATFYGEDLGRRYIHVHHIRPLAEGERATDPRTELIPVCPNCHAMLHARKPPLSPDELRSILRKAK